MSGYAGDAIAHHGVLDPGTQELTAMAERSRRADALRAVTVRSVAASRAEP